MGRTGAPQERCTGARPGAPPETGTDNPSTREAGKGRAALPLPHGERARDQRTSPRRPGHAFTPIKKQHPQTARQAP